MMRVTFPLAVLIAVTGTLAAVAHREHAAAERRHVSVCFAIDGDTLRCDVTDRIRLNGIDAAEMPGHCRPGRVCVSGDPYASRDHLALYLRQPVTIEPLKLDRYGRTVANVYRRETGESLSCLQLAAGQAVYVEKWDVRNTTAASCREFVR